MRIEERGRYTGRVRQFARGGGGGCQWCVSCVFTSASSLRAVCWCMSVSARHFLCNARLLPVCHLRAGSLPPRVASHRSIATRPFTTVLKARHTHTHTHTYVCSAHRDGVQQFREDVRFECLHSYFDRAVNHGASCRAPLSLPLPPSLLPSLPRSPCQGCVSRH